jgi:hypothetical protein
MKTARDKTQELALEDAELNKISELGYHIQQSKQSE